MPILCKKILLNVETFTGIMTKIVLITGGAGFIGTHVPDALLARGYEPRHTLESGVGERADWLRRQIAQDRAGQAAAELS